VTSTIVAVGSVAFLLYLLLDDPGQVPVLTWVLLVFFLGVGALLSVGNYGDRISLDDEGIRISNRFVRALGLRGERSLAWDEVVRLKEHRRRTLFLVREKGAPMVLDSIADYAALREEIAARSGLSLPERDAVREARDEIPQ
jgi:hypothetical protein